MKNEHNFAMGGGSRNQLNPRKHSKLKVLTLVLFLLLALLGTSYAFFSWSYEGKEDNLLSTPDISFRLLESNKEVIGIENGVPMTDEQGMSQTGTGNVFDFEVRSKFTGTKDVKYKVNLEKLSIDEGLKQIPDNEIKVYVEDFEGKTVLEPTKISDLDNYNLFIKTDRHSKDNEEISSKYRLKVWLSQEVDIFNNENRQYKFKINIGTNEEEQNKDQTYNLVYNLNGGTGNINSTSFKVGDKVTITSTVPTKEGYKFLGWSTNKNSKEAEYVGGEQVSLTNAYNNTVTLYAIWKENIVYTVKYNPNGGFLNIGFTSTTSNYAWEEINGVYRSGNYNVNSSTSTMKSDEFTLTESSDISFDWAVSSESSSYDYLYYTIYKDGTALSGTGTSTKIGGYTSSDTEENLTYKTVTKTLEAGTYYIEFSYRKDGSGNYGLDRGYVKKLTIPGYGEDKTMEDSTFESGTNKLSKNIYVKPHYIFKGWSLSKDATNIAYQDEQEVNNLTKKNNDIVNLYAVWEKEKYTVNVVVQNGTVDTSSKEISYDENGTFNLTTNVEGAIGSVTCTNNQKGKIENNVLTVSNVSASTTCTVNFKDTFTTLYEDGTLIINESTKNRNENLSTHGNITKEYDAMSDSNSYVMGKYSQPWYSEKSSIKSVEIGQKIEPISTKSWFYSLTNMEKGDFTNLDTSNVTDMSSMFEWVCRGIKSFELKGLSNWNISKVADMNSMFRDAGSSATTFNIGDLSNWDTSSVTNMNYMFLSTGKDTTTFDIGDLSNWDVSKVTSMSSMFQAAGKSATTFNLDISNWDTSSVTTMSDMFSGAGYSATTFNLDISNWDTSKVTSMGNMFDSAGYRATTWSIGDLSNWNTSSVTHMGSMFYDAGHRATTFNLDISNWDTSKVTNMGSMFYNAGTNAATWTVGDLSNWDTSKVTSMYRMFYYAGSGATTFNLNLSNWDTSSVTDMGNMFRSAGARATTWSIGDLSNWNTSSVTNMSYMFASAGSRATTFTLDLSNWDTSSVTNMSSMFYETALNATTWSVKIPSKTGDLTNTTSKWYGSSESVYDEPDNGKFFTLAN